MNSETLSLGIDVGSTTVKVVIINEKGEILFSTYQRHMSDVRHKIITILGEVSKKFPNKIFKLSLTGSGALSLDKKYNSLYILSSICYNRR